MIFTVYTVEMKCRVNYTGTAVRNKDRVKREKYEKHAKSTYVSSVKNANSLRIARYVVHVIPGV